MLNTLGILPAAGAAQRFGGIPKFLLPISPPWTSLLEYHINLLRPYVDQLLVPTRPAWIEIVENLVAGSGAEVFPLETKTMSETVIKASAGRSFSVAMIGMPDTYFSSTDANPYEAIITSSIASNLSVEQPGAVVGTYATGEHQRGHVGSVLTGDASSVSAHADKDGGRDYGRHWGQLYVTQPVMSLLDARTPHVGYVLDSLLEGGHNIMALKQEGNYVDCGTFEEYRRTILELKGRQV